MLSSGINLSNLSQNLKKVTKNTNSDLPARFGKNEDDERTNLNDTESQNIKKFAEDNDVYSHTSEI